MVWGPDVGILLFVIKLSKRLGYSMSRENLESGSGFILI